MATKATASTASFWLAYHDLFVFRSPIAQLSQPQATFDPLTDRRALKGLAA